MKKIFATFILISLLVGALTSCGGYEPVKSTEEEARVIASLSIDGEKYEIKYELYRAFFLTHRSEVDGGDESVWTGDEKDVYSEKIDSIVFKQISEIYATIHAAKKIGKDVLSSRYDDEVSEYIKASVDGGSYGGQYFEGYGEDYDKYLESLKKKNLNYSVQDLIIRYAIAANEIQNYYAPSLNGGKPTDNSIEYSEETLREFYESDGAVRMLNVFLDAKIWKEANVKAERDKIANCATESDVALRMIGISTSGASEIQNGTVIGRHTLDSAYFQELTETAFSMSVGQVSEPIYVNTGDADGYYIIYIAEKSEENFKALYDNVTEAYLYDKIYEKIDLIRDSLLESLQKEASFELIDKSQISMD